MASAQWPPSGLFSALPSCCELQSRDVCFWHLADFSGAHQGSDFGSKATLRRRSKTLP